MIDPDLEDAPAASQVSEQTLRSFAAICLGIFGLPFGLGWYRRAGEPTLAGWISVAVAVLVGVPGLIKPSLVRPVFLGATALTYPLGKLMNVVLLGAIYYGLVTPVALAFRLAGRDVLRRRRPNVSTYWVARNQNRDVGRYLRQYQEQ